jgi:hypothetical protein
MHGNAESEAEPGTKYDDIVSLFLHFDLNHKTFACGRALRIQPRGGADGVESPGALASPYINSSKDHRKQVMSRVPRILYT